MKTKHSPRITNATRPLTFEVEALNERGEALPTPIAGENPLIHLEWLLVQLE